MAQAHASYPGLSARGGVRRRVARALPEEVAVAVTVNGSTHAVMMATPADLADFATGFALTEGLIHDAGQIERLELIDHPDGLEARLWLPEALADAVATRRRAMAGPVGCGLCGIESLEEAVRTLPRLPDGFTLGEDAVAGATEALSAHQPHHDRTHAMHAAGFLRADGSIAPAREDVGRHNALDKLIGALAVAGEDAGTGAFVITSRVSVEMVQKTVLAGATMLIAVSAPTAHAVRLAEEAGLTLVAFARGGGFDVYAHPQRIQEV